MLMTILLVMQGATDIQDPAKKSNKELYAATNVWLDCARQNVIANKYLHDSSPTKIAEEAVTQCGNDRNKIRAKAYEFVLHMASPAIAAQKADAMEFEFRYTLIKQVRDEIEQVKREAAE